MAVLPVDLHPCAQGLVDANLGRIGGSVGKVDALFRLYLIFTAKPNSFMAHHAPQFKIINPLVVPLVITDGRCRATT